MRTIFSIACLCFLNFLPGEAAVRPLTLQSPDGKLRVEIRTGKGPTTYSVYREGQCLLLDSRLGLLLDDGTEWGKDAVVRSKKSASLSEHVSGFMYRTTGFTSACNQLDLRMKGGYGIIFRAYDEGIAYRFYSTGGAAVIRDEVAEFNFDRDYLSYRAYSTVAEGEERYAMAFQNLYTKVRLTEADTANIAFLPVTIDYGNGVKLTLAESDLEAYPGMFVRGDGASYSLKGVFAPYPSRMDYRPWRHMSYVAERSSFIAKTEGARPFPWRVLAVSGKDTEMPVNNLVYALASPNRIGDCSWVKGGKVAWDWWNDWGIYGIGFKAGINTETYKHYIDFAAENGIPYVILDEGWYDPKAGDMLAVIPGLDLPGLAAYAGEKKVGLILWTVFNVLDGQLEEACRTYAAMGIKGFKVDFLDRDDQTAVEMVYRIADACAGHHLLLDLHGIYKPTGLNRTYPNVVNFESVFGMEEMKWSTAGKDMMQYDVEMPFIRMMAGPVDYTPGAMRNATKQDFRAVYSNPMSQGTRCHQLAAYVVHDSPLTMLADNPTAYRKEQECADFIAGLPNTGIEETRILQGVLGEFIVTARRVGTDWYVGGMTNWDGREVALDLSFLGEGSYAMTLFRDGVNASKQASDYKKETSVKTAADSLNLPMAPGGGFAISFVKE